MYNKVLFMKAISTLFFQKVFAFRPVLIITGKAIKIRAVGTKKELFADRNSHLLITLSLQIPCL